MPRPPPPVGDRRSQLSAPPPLRNQPPLQPAVRPQRPRPLPGRRPPPPQKSPPPPQKSGGIIDGIRDTITVSYLLPAREGQWAIYYFSLQSFIITFSFTLA